MLDLFSLSRAVAAFDDSSGDELSAVALDIQRTLLDVALPRTGGLDVGLRAAPGRLVGGDYLDVVDGATGPIFGIGEVSGRSLPAALKALSFKFAMRGILRAGGTGATRGEDLSLALEHANAVVGTMLQPDEYFSALLFGVEPARGRLVYANAGHPPPLIYRASTNDVEEPAPEGLVFGVASTVRYRARELTLGPEDAAAFYTDGFTDARNAAGETFTVAAAKAALRECRGLAAQAAADDLFARLERHTVGTYRDDASLLVIRLEG